MMLNLFGLFDFFYLTKSFFLALLNITVDHSLLIDEALHTSAVLLFMGFIYWLKSIARRPHKARSWSPVHLSDVSSLWKPNFHDLIFSKIILKPSLRYKKLFGVLKLKIGWWEGHFFGNMQTFIEE